MVSLLFAIITSFAHAGEHLDSCSAIQAEGASVSAAYQRELARAVAASEDSAEQGPGEASIERLLIGIARVERAIRTSRDRARLDSVRARLVEQIAAASVDESTLTHLYLNLRTLKDKIVDCQTGPGQNLAANNRDAKGGGWIGSSFDRPLRGAIVPGAPRRGGSTLAE